MSKRTSFATEGDEDDVVSTINTTPLVDVMLVLLIIFLITIPVVTQTVAVKLPRESNAARQTRPENIEVSVTQDGVVYWNLQALHDEEALLQRLRQAAAASPPPEIHIRGDAKVRYESIGKVLAAAQRAGVHKISFITEPAPKG